MVTSQIEYESVIFGCLEIIRLQRDLVGIIIFLKKREIFYITMVYNLQCTMYKIGKLARKDVPIFI